MPTIIDPNIDKSEITILPDVDTTNPDFKGFPKQLSGSFLQVRIEVNNGTDNNLCNLQFIPQLPSNLQQTQLVFSYVVYPRPLVPAKFDPASGKIIQGGDDFGSLRTGWRFNQPEGEMLVNIGNTLNLLQASRRAYFIFLFKIDSTLAPGVYSIDFSSSGKFVSYSGKDFGKFNYKAPPVMFSITRKKSDGTILEYQKFVLGQSNLKQIQVQGTNAFRGVGTAKWSNKQITYLDFDTLKNVLPVAFDNKNLIETIDLSSFKNFPQKDMTKFYVLEKVEANSSNLPDKFNLTTAENLLYEVPPVGNFVTTDKALTLSSVGPKITHFKRISAIDGKQISENTTASIRSGNQLLEVTFYLLNTGSDIAENARLEFSLGKYFNIHSGQSNVSQISVNRYQVSTGIIVPGELKELKLQLDVASQICANWFDDPEVIKDVVVRYDGPRSKFATKKEAFTYTDNSPLEASSQDIFVRTFLPNVRKVKAGEKVSLGWVISNGVVPIKETINYDIYAILNLKDTVLIYRDTISSFELLDSRNGKIEYVVPDSIFYLEFALRLDPENKLPEACKNNNFVTTTMELAGPDWMRKVNVYPNPFDYFTLVSYVITQGVSHLDAYVFAVDGTFVTKIEDCPHQLGLNQFYLEMPDLAKGTYVIRFEGTTPENERVINYIKLLKEK